MPESIKNLERKLRQVNNPEERIALLLKLSSLIRHDNIQQAGAYAMEVVRLSKKEQDFESQVRTLEALGFIIAELPITDKCELLENLTLAYEGIGDPIKALSYHKQLLEARLKETAEKASVQTTEITSNPEFEFALHRQYPTLTKTELRICSLMKSHLTSQQIADHMYTSLRTVEWHRLNIRKKLHISDHQEIPLFLDEIMSEISNR